MKSKEAQAREFLACQTGATMRFLPLELMDALLAKLDLLSKQPVVVRCGACAHRDSSDGACLHDDAPLTSPRKSGFHHVGMFQTPPGWCPLRDEEVRCVVVMNTRGLSVPQGKAAETPSYCADCGHDEVQHVSDCHDYNDDGPCGCEAFVPDDAAVERAQAAVP